MLRTLLFFLLLLSEKPITGQTWFPDEATWHYNQVIFFPPANSYQKFEVIGEETILGKTTKIIRGLCQCGTFGDLNYLYEENDRIFIYAAEADSFQVLYDFNLVAGDTLTVIDDFQGNSYFLIDSITFFQAGSLNLRVQHIHLIEGIHQMGTKIYERIGSNGCLYPVVGICDPGTAGLRCYEDEETGLLNFQQPEMACDFVSAVNETESVSSVKVYPNPAYGFISVESDKGIEEIELVHVGSGIKYKLSGHSAYKMDVDLGKMQVGVYVIKVITAERSGVEVMKVVVIGGE